MGDDEKANELEDLRKKMNYPLIKNCDMNEEMRQDCVDLVITAIERYAGNFESASRLIKETMDKFTETLGTKQKEADAFAKKHQISQQGMQQASSAAPEDEEGGAQGVLI